jgi:hypothetical protein
MRGISPPGLLASRGLVAWMLVPSPGLVTGRRPAAPSVEGAAAVAAEGLDGGREAPMAATAPLAGTAADRVLARVQDDQAFPRHPSALLTGCRGYEGTAGRLHVERQGLGNL